jgi:hypothetical protein
MFPAILHLELTGGNSDGSRKIGPCAGERFATTVRVDFYPRHVKHFRRRLGPFFLRAGLLRAWALHPPSFNGSRFRVACAVTALVMPLESARAVLRLTNDFQLTSWVEKEAWRRKALFTSQRKPPSLLTLAILTQGRCA